VRPFWISLAILIALFAALQAHTVYLRNFLQPLQEELHTAALYAGGEQWEKALARTRKVQSAWREREKYLHMTLRHADSDLVNARLEDLLSYLEHRMAGDYQAVNSNLIRHLGLLYDMEKLKVENVL
jgi:hypothetical protein